MDRARRILETLGPEGASRVLRDALDREAVVRAANACRVSYPGKRTQSVPAPTLIADIVKKAAEGAEAALALVKALDKECGAEMREAGALDAAALERAAEEPLPAGRRAGRFLYALAADPRPESQDAARRLLSGAPPGEPAAGGNPPAEAGRAARDEAEALRERLARAERAREEAEQTAAGAREEAEAAAAQLLAVRKQAHALEGRVQRLTEENARLHERGLVLSGRVEELERGAESAKGLAAVAAEFHRALRDSQKVLHELRDLAASRAAGASESARPYLEALAATVRAVQNEIAELRREREADRRKEREAITDLAREAHTMRVDLASVKAAAAERPVRRKGEALRVGLFVDVQNMYYAARQLNARLDFGALIETVTRERRLIRAIAYVVQNRDIDQSGFLAMLQQRNYEVRRKDLKVRADGSSKGDWDMEMALDVLAMADALDVVVLASGDGDFVPLVNHVKTLGPRVEVYSFPGSTAKELIEAADRHVPIDEGLLIRLSSAS